MPQKIPDAGLKHDPEKWVPVSEKIMLKQKAKAKWWNQSKAVSL
jgi:hypothetical protein